MLMVTDCLTAWQLLSLLDVELAEEVGETVLRALLEAHPNITPRFPADEAAMLAFSAESALLLRVFCQVCKEQKAAPKIDAVLPEVPLSHAHPHVHHAVRVLMVTR